MSGRVFQESIYAYGGQYVRVDEMLHEGRSDYQDVLLFRGFYGGVLVLDGVLVTQNDEPCHHGRAMAETSGALRHVFREVRPFVAPVPAFAGGHMAFLAATNADLELAASRTRFEPPDAGYYTPAVHAASFVVPPYVLWAMRDS